MHFLVCFIFSLILFSCSNQDTEEYVDLEKWNKKKSLSFNKARLKEEDLQIKIFLEGRQDLKMDSTGTGLRYMIYKNGDGLKPLPGDSADVQMTVSLLDGTVCYQTDSAELDQFLIDRSHLETGIQEAIKLMKVGDRSKLILPSHLAHGLLGDFKKIPPMAVLFVDIYLHDVIKPF